MELIRAGENTYYIDCYAKVGVYVKTDREVYLIDSGTNDAEGSEILHLLRQRG